MSPFFWKNSQSVEHMIEEYMASLDKCMEAFSNGLKLYLLSGCQEKFKKLQRETHRYESRADDIRREIELKLYGKAL
ncbi:hypothetical protein KKF84_11700, partial [Myxococcota bacterium]|nr:hypothetical protein [Myxococcota bacterium]